MHVIKVATGQLAHPKVLTAADTSGIQSGTASEAAGAGGDLQLPSKLHLHLCAKRDSERHSLHVWARNCDQYWSRYRITTYCTKKLGYGCRRCSSNAQIPTKKHTKSKACIWATHTWARGNTFAWPFSRFGWFTNQAFTAFLAGLAGLTCTTFLALALTCRGGMTIAAMEYVIRSTFGHSRCNHNSSNTYTCTNANCGCTITVRAKAQVCVDKQGRTTQTRYRAHARYCVFPAIAV
jgi:hypothetical protein